MKHILFLLLFPAALLAQDQPDTTAVTYENRGGIFYTVTKTTFQSGRIVTEETPLGADTAGVVNAIIGPVFTATTDAANKAVQVARLNRVRQQVVAANTALNGLVGQDYFSVVQNAVGQEFLPDTIQSISATIRIDGGSPITASIRRNAAGRLVFRQGTQNFTLDIVSRNWIRLRRYQGTETLATDAVIVDLFKETEGRWISLDLKYILRF
jgi:hypothetical protein